MSRGRASAYSGLPFSITSRGKKDPARYHADICGEKLWCLLGGDLFHLHVKHSGLAIHDEKVQPQHCKAIDSLYLQREDKGQRPENQLLIPRQSP